MRPAPTGAEPVDRLFAGYLLLSAPALLFAHRSGAWLPLLALHVVAAVLLLQTHRLPGAGAGRAARALLDWLPLLAVPLLYTELAALNSAVHGGHYFDHAIFAVEQALFGNPSRTWAQAAPNLLLSEALHAAYLSFYFIIFAPPVVLWLQRRRAAFRDAVFAVMLGFFAHYLFFVYFPVQGPRYLFPAPAGALEAGAFYQLAHRVLEAGSAQGSAFPSSHVGVAVIQTLVAVRLLPRLAPVLAILTTGLALGAIYGGFHYATDAVAGLVLGTVAFVAARPLQRRLAR